MNLIADRSAWIGMLFVVATFPASSATVLTEGHIDVGIVYEDGAWDLHVHRESPSEEEFAPDDAILRVGAVAMLAGGVPNTPAATGFFGPAGSPLWILPKSENPELPFLGIGTEEMSSDDWTGALTLTLKAVEGPGDFFLWDVGSFGELVPKMSSRDGVSEADAVAVLAGSHGHYFWAFSAPGEYVVSFAASGVHAVDGAVASDPAGYRFEVVPEPGVGSLLLAGGVVLGWRKRLRRGMGSGA